MVKKLLKYEFQFFLKRCLPLWCIVLGTAVLNRVIQCFETDKTAYNIMFYSSVAFLVIGCLIVLIGTMVTAVDRYYKNMFTNEGYLTMSLPVTADQHLGAKLLTSLIFLAFSLIAVILSINIALLGDVLSEVWKAEIYVIREAGKVLGADFWFYCLEFLLAFILTEAKLILLFYACISLGQRAKKNRVGHAVLYFFIYYFACQTLGTITTVFFAIFTDAVWFMELISWVGLHARLCIHLGLCFIILWTAGFGCLYYFLSRHTIKSKLNLE